MAKHFVANSLNRIIDRAIQVHGALGYSKDTPLADMFQHARWARFADGADEIHQMRIAERTIAGVHSDHGTTTAATGDLPICESRLTGDLGARARRAARGAPSSPGAWAATRRSRSTATLGQAHRSASASTRCSTRARSTRSARSPAAAAYDDDGTLVDVHARELRDGPRPHRRPAGRRRRRRLHRARRRGRRVDLPEAGARRAHGERPRPADRAARRRLGRRRLGEVARDRAARVRAVQPGLGVGRREPRDACRWSSLCLGSVAGLGAARVVTSHYSMMVKGTSPAVRRRARRSSNRLGIETVDKETLGGSAIHTRNGAVDDEVDDRGRGVRARPPVPLVPPALGRRAAAARPSRPTTPSAREALARRRDPARARARSTRCASIIDAVVDRGSFFEIGRGYGPVARSPGSPASTAGRSRCSPTTRTSTPAAGPPTRREKVERFVDLAETFHLPVVHLVDNPGFVIGTDGRAGRRRSATAPGRSPRSTRRRCRGAR